MSRPFIKWMGGKTRLMPELLKALPEGDVLIEPFVGAGSVFLNTNYKEYILGDTNPDLISLLKFAATKPEALLEEAKPLFQNENTRDAYLKRRVMFNDTDNPLTELSRAAVFLYLNRHGYNGLCRYNQSGGYNVPYGGDKTTPYYPGIEVMAFAAKVARCKVKFVCQSFEKTILLANKKKGVVIYADPPYLPNSKTASFSQYHKSEFGQLQHRKLAELLLAAAGNGHKVVLSNSDTMLTREIYYGFNFKRHEVGRYLGADKDKRGVVNEVIATID